MSLRPLTDADMQAWACLPETARFLQHLQASKQEAMEAWARQAYTGETGEHTLQANAKALGGVDCLTRTIEYIEDLMLEAQTPDVERVPA